ncbi:SpoIID/LytB domain-containing protein, partial [Modestobacter altitudinis]|uniref:SpoIID/LytB domain-containing protein n=1 Tax=Modestobacter altitudinis TaxID=2213158 RepID=UPI001487374D
MAASAILDFYHPGTVSSRTSRTSRTSIRVLVTHDGTDVRVLPDAALAVTDGATGRSALLPTGLGALQWRAVRSGPGIALQYTVDGSVWKPWSMPGGPEALAGPVSFGGPEITRTVVPAGTRGYRDQVQAVVSGSTLHTVNEPALDDYLRGVVPRESPSSWPAPALQAQAVAARSYAVYAIEHHARSRYHDVCDTTSCQVYSGARSHAGSAVTDLEPASTDPTVAATALHVHTYAGATVFAQFSSANGGWTAAGNQPHLTAREDPWDGVTGFSAHSWTTSVAASTIEATYLGIGRLVELRVSARDGNGDWGGRVTSVVLTGSARTVTVIGETSRSVTGIRSTWFLVTNAADALAGRYASDAGWRALLGAPIGGESSTPGVSWQQYERGYAYWTAATGAHSVSGQIWGVYMAAGGPTVLGA